MSVTNPFKFRQLFSQISRFSDCGHTESGDFDHGNTCASLRGSSSEDHKEKESKESDSKEKTLTKNQHKVLGRLKFIPKLQKNEYMDFTTLKRMYKMDRTTIDALVKKGYLEGHHGDFGFEVKLAGE